MNKDQILGTIRPIVTAVLSLVAAKYFQDGSVLEGAVASLFAGVSLLWGAIDKTEKGYKVWVSVARHFFAAASGIMYALIPDNKATEIIALIVTALTAIGGTIQAQPTKK